MCFCIPGIIQPGLMFFKVKVQGLWGVSYFLEVYSSTP